MVSMVPLASALLQLLKIPFEGELPTHHVRHRAQRQRACACSTAHGSPFLLLNPFLHEVLICFCGAIYQVLPDRVLLLHVRDAGRALTIHSSGRSIVNHQLDK